MLSTILTIVLILLLIGALPTWPYSTGWGYYPGGRARPYSHHCGRFSVGGAHIVEGIYSCAWRALANGRP